MRLLSSVGPASYLSPMSAPSEDPVARLERELEQVERAMSAVATLNARQAERVGQRMDRLASQLLEITTPQPLDDMLAELGLTRATDKDFASIAGELGPADGEG